MHRYAHKSRRALFLARQADTFVGFSLVIEFLDPPGDIPAGQAAQLRDFACGTGLMVLAPWRGRGIGRQLVEHWELWARDQAHAGLWCVTHRMGGWYRNCLGFRKLGRTRSKGVDKTIMVKRF